jgi:DNA polymerase III alpha subunit
MSPIREFKNRKNDGKYIALMIADKSGMCELVAFDREVDKVKELLIGKIYKISNATCITNSVSLKSIIESVDLKKSLNVGDKFEIEVKIEGQAPLFVTTEVK